MTKLDEGYKNKLGKQLTLKMATCLQNGEITLNQASVIAALIEDNLLYIDSQNQLMSFLARLSEKWPIFNNIYNIEAGKLEEQKDKKTASKVTKLIKENKIDSALKLSKKANKKAGIK